ncbi:IclR family transcriptional regulator [Actinocorallia herbida]|uniref:IclR family transcriptional regulator n=1 Tax=Actinocorallia herbida TaxID=58109 RepID=A0A3N1D1W3_9ACTN|nr:IclR family transcriptional regulator [Actinocorallia herbida]ROO87501.1 IclR family transcriptional regulator [Actinocorallia herbida]
MRATPAAGERTVLGRIASVMEAFNDGHKVLSLGDLNEHTHLPKSTLHRLADQLCQVGWLERASGGYRVGMRLFELGNLAVEGSRLQEVALPHLQALAAKVGMAVQLAVLDTVDVVYLERVMVGPLRLPTRRGGRKPAYCTALGKAMLAFDEEAAQAAASARMPKCTPRTIVDPSALRTELQRIREAGIAFDRGEAFDNLVCVAAPIRRSGRAIGAVSVTGLAGRMRWNTTTEAVRGTAAAIWNATYSVQGAAGAWT